MSKRKQAAIEAARREVAREAEGKKTSWLKNLKNPTSLIVIGIFLLLIIGVIGATVGSQKGNSVSSTATKSDSGFGGLLTSSAPQPAAPLPSPTPPPQLAKEYLYAGSRMLAVEDANAPHSSNQPLDLVVWRKSNGAWYIRDSSLPPDNPTYSTNVFGMDGDKAVPADFDGDGLYDFCVYRPSNGTWYIQPNNGGTSFYGVQFGLSTDEPAPADYDGDGRADVAVWRDTASGSPVTPPSFIILNSSTNTASIVNIGQTGDKAIPADYDGDGRADVAVYRPSSGAWWIKQSASNGTLVGTTFGNPNETPVAGDFDGDGKFDLAVVRFTASQWQVKQSSNGQTVTIPLAMLSGDIPVAGDYVQAGSTQTDGITDAAVWRPSNGTWYIRLSQNGNLRQEQWGANGDTPIPAPFRR